MCLMPRTFSLGLLHRDTLWHEALERAAACSTWQSMPVYEHCTLPAYPARALLKCQGSCCSLSMPSFLRRGMGPAAGLAPFTEALLQARRLSGQSACCRPCQTQCLPPARAAGFASRARHHQRRWARARRRQLKQVVLSAFSSGLQGVPPASLLLKHTYQGFACLCTMCKRPHSFAV